MNVYQPVARWRVPGDLLPKSLELMRDDGARGCEGIGLWLGVTASDEATITHLVEVPEIWVEKRPDFLCVSEIAFAALGDICERDGCYLVGQIHSHPGDFVDLSYADREYGIQAPYFFSVVAPHYAQRPRTAWNDCGVHQFLPGAGFQRFDRAEILRRVVVDRSRSVQVVTLEVAP